MNPKRRPRRPNPEHEPDGPAKEVTPVVATPVLHLNLNTIISSLALALLLFISRIIYEDHGSLAILSDRFAQRSESTERNLANINAELAAIRTKQSSLEIDIAKLRNGTPTK